MHSSFKYKMRTHMYHRAMLVCVKYDAMLEHDQGATENPRRWLWLCCRLQ